MKLSPKNGDPIFFKGEENEHADRGVVISVEKMKIYWHGDGEICFYTPSSWKELVLDNVWGLMSLTGE